MEFSVVREIAAPAAVAWQVLVDVEKWPEWTASMSSVSYVQHGPLAPGSRVRIKQPRLPQTVWTVTDFVPGSKFAWTAKSPGAVTIASHVLESTPTGTQVTLSIEQSGVLGAIFGSLFSALTRRYVTMEADGLKRRAEQAASQSVG